MSESTKPGSRGAGLAKRKYKDDVELSIIGMGGIVVTDVDQGEANNIVAWAVERGVNYFDVAPSYGDAEVKLGPALEPYRGNIFLACKTAHRDRGPAEAELRQSLANLKTDYFDLYQLHAITDVAGDVEAAFIKDGVMPLLIEARKQGRIRHLGFSAHSVPAALAAMDKFDFDSMLFPVNFATFYKGNFGPQMMAKAQAKGVARLALKALARQHWPKDDPQRKGHPKIWYQPITDAHEQDLAVRFTLSQPITAALPPGEEALFRRAVEIGLNYRPLNEAEDRELRELAKKMNPLFEAA